jgi:hypothetical protein
MEKAAINEQKRTENIQRMMNIEKFVTREHESLKARNKACQRQSFVRD